MTRFQDISDAAEASRAAELHLRQLCETISLMRRDLLGLAELVQTQSTAPDHWDRFTDLLALTARAMRRKLSFDELTTIHKELTIALDQANALLPTPETKEMSTSDCQNEQHQQSSKKELYEIESRIEKAKQETDGSPETTKNPETVQSDKGRDNVTTTALEPNITLSFVLASCPQFLSFADQPIRHWRDFTQAADRICPMMGIATSVWRTARNAMGAENAAIVLAAMLERFSDIHNPGGYLRCLSVKAANASFTPGPMLMALQHRAAA